MAIRSNRFIRYLSLFTIISFALIDATQQQWICDDAYLSLRYAENLVQGEGLTYNPGEYVEGYSNFLWTLLLALCQFLGAQPESMSMTLGILCYAGTLLGLYRFGWVALAGGAFALHMRIYASSGLETMMFLCLITWGVYAIKERRLALYSIIACASFLCRPEGGLLLLLGVIPFWQERGRYLRYILPVVGTYLLWKMWYFGDVLPNTYYAKGSGVRYNDGFRYLGLFFSMYWVALLGILHCISKKRSFFVLSFIFCYALYLLKTGGGFMFGRLALPLYLMLMISFEFWLEGYRKSRTYWSCFFMIALGLLLTPYPKGLLENPMGIDGIVEEKNWYPQSVIDKSRTQGEILASFVRDTDAKTVIFGAQAMLAYHAKLPWVLEGMAGLTDKELAKKPSKSKRIGHGRKADLEYMRIRGIDVLFHFRNPMNSPAIVQIDFNGVKGTLVQYRPELMETLRQRGARFVNMESFIDSYTQEEHSMEEWREMYQFLQPFYFRPSKDMHREGIFLKKIGGASD